MKKHYAIFLSLSVLAILTAFGGDSDASSGGGDADAGGGGTNAWVGSWTLVEETGGPFVNVLQPSVDYFINMTLDGTNFQSSYRDPEQNCSWRGTLTVSGNVMQWSNVSSSGFPCSQADGKSGPVTWSKPDDNTLVLDFRSGFPAGTLQTYNKSSL